MSVCHLPVYQFYCLCVCLLCAINAPIKPAFALFIITGYIETDMTSALDKENLFPLIPLGRLGTAEEVAGKDSIAGLRKRKRGIVL